MPDHGYISRNHPPSLFDHVRAHWDAFITGGFGVIVGVLIVIGGLSPNFDPSPSLAELPDWLNFVIGIVMTSGSIARMFSISRSYESLADYWLVHRLSTAGQALGWLCYAFAAFWLRTYSLVPWLMGFCMATMPAVSCVESFLEERRVRGDLARDPAERQEGPPA